MIETATVLFSKNQVDWDHKAVIRQARRVTSEKGRQPLLLPVHLKNQRILWSNVLLHVLTLLPLIVNDLLTSQHERTFYFLHLFKKPSDLGAIVICSINDLSTNFPVELKAAMCTNYYLVMQIICEESCGCWLMLKVQILTDNSWMLCGSQNWWALWPWQYLH